MLNALGILKTFDALYSSDTPDTLHTPHADTLAIPMSRVSGSFRIPRASKVPWILEYLEYSKLLKFVNTQRRTFIYFFDSKN